jgi:hypothetical protein
LKNQYLILASFSILPFFCNANETVTYEAICDDTKKMVSVLTDKYKEKPIVIGDAVDRAASIMTLWTNKKTKTWSIIATKGEISCLIGAGGNLEYIPQKSETLTKTF